MRKDELAHYGVLGMRWGRRSGGRGSNLKRSEESSTAVKLKKRDARTLTNAEISTTLNRLSLEKQFRDAKKSAGQKLVQEVITNSGKAVMTAATTAVMMKYAKEFLKPYGITLGKDKDK